MIAPRQPTIAARGTRETVLYGPNGHLIQIERQGAAADRALRALAKSSRSMFAAAAQNRHNAEWLTSNQDVNVALSSQLGLMRQRSRWLALNDANGAAFMNTLLAYCVGTGFSLSMECAKPVKAKDGVIEFVEMENHNDYVMDRYSVWSRDVLVDASLSSPINEAAFQEMAFRFWATDGELFCHKVIDKTRGKDVPLVWELIDPGQLDCYRTQAPNGNPVLMGVELDKRTWRPVAYWVFVSDPENLGLSMSSNSVRIPATHMIHLFKRLMPRQVRGVPFFHAVMNRFFQLSQYDEALLIRQKLAAMFAPFITGGEGGGSMLGAQEGDDTDANGFPVDADGNVVAHLQPGLISKMPDGYKLNVLEPIAPEAQYAAYVQAQQSAISAGAGPGMSATGMTRDTTRTTFAGGRMAENMDVQGYRPLMNFFTSGLLAARFWIWMDTAVMAGDVSAPTWEIDPDFWMKHSFKPGGWSRGINPLQEVNAAAKSMELGITTLDDECSYGGRDWDKQVAAKGKIQRRMLREFKKTKALAEELKLDAADMASALKDEFGETVMATTESESTSVVVDEAERAARAERRQAEEARLS